MVTVTSTPGWCASSMVGNPDEGHDVLLAEGRSCRPHPEGTIHMSVASEVAAHLPYLRRFARAVTGNQRSGDAYVASALEAIVADPDIFPRELPTRVALYQTFLKILNSVTLNERDSRKPGSTGALDAADRHLDVLTPRARQAFLLVSVEDFSPSDAAQVMDVSPTELQSLIDQAGREIAQEMATSVVIIEDEPLIAMELEQLVGDLGHRVVQVARTRQQANAAIQKHRPGLVLADIQLADGSSGLDAINDVLKTFEVAVVFITAYPHRLLTGTRPEPTFLITKPFQADNVKAIISQALFFDTKARLAPAPT